MTNRGDLVLTDQLQAYVSGILDELGGIPEERRPLLDDLARYVDDRIARSGNAKLVFICTHNSRRSHMSQIWAQTAAGMYLVLSSDTPPFCRLRL